MGTEGGPGTWQGGHGDKGTWAHLHDISELQLVEEEGDEVPGTDGPRGHQLSPVVEDPHLQGQR